MSESLRAELIRKMHKTGCRLDDAAACADVALQEIKVWRERVVLALLRPQLSIRQAAVETGMSKSRVHQIASSGVALAWTAANDTLPPAA